MTPRRFLIVSALLVAALAILVGGPAAMRASFLNYDDPGVVIDNPRLDHPSASDVVGTFTERREHAWLPVYLLALMPEASLFGKASAVPFRVASVVWHVIACVLVLAFVHALLRDRTAALLGAAVFAVHPVLAESVAWISGRKDQVSLCLALLACAAALGHLRRGGLRRLVLSVVFLGLGLMAKGTLVSAPLLIALLIVVTRRDGTRHPGARPGLLLAVTGAITLILGAIHWSIARAEGTAVDPTAGGLAAHLVQALEAVARYAKNVVFPLDLSVHYDLRATSLTIAVVCGAAIALGLLVFALAAGARDPRVRTVGVACAWILCAMLPFNGIFPRTSLAMADRYLILAMPMVGVLLAMAVRPFGRVVRVALPIVLLAALTAAAHSRYAAFTTSEVLFESATRHDPLDSLPMLKLGEAFRDRGTEAGRREAVRLFAASAAASPDPVREARARILLADTLRDSGRHAEAIQEYSRLDALVAEHGDVLRTFGFDADVVRYNRAAAEIAIGRTDLARPRIEEVLAANPGFARARALRAGLDAHAAFSLLKPPVPPGGPERARVLVDGALADYGRVIDEQVRIRDDTTLPTRERRVAIDLEIQARSERTRLFQNATWLPNHLNDAAQGATALISEFPGRAEAWIVHAQVFGAGDAEAEARDLLTAVEKNPRSLPALRAVADLCLRAGRNQQAVKSLERALDLDPDDRATLRALADLYIAVARKHKDPGPEEGVRDLAKAHVAVARALIYVPDDAEALALDGTIWEAGNEWEKAEGAWRRAREIDPGNRTATHGLARFHQARGLATLARLAKWHGSETRPDSRAALAERDELAARALADFRTAVNTAPDSDELDFARGRIRAEDRRGTVDPLLDRAAHALDNKDWSLALSIAEGAVALDEAYPRTFELVGQAAFRAGDTTRSRAAFERVLALEPDNLQANDFAARFAYDAGDYESARIRAKRFIRVAGAESRPAAFLAVEVESMGKLLKAIEALRPETRPR